MDNRSGFGEFCGGDLWDENLTWNNDFPDFTPCFQSSVLVWVPCGFLWILLPFCLCYLRTLRKKSHAINKLNGAKTVLAVLLVVSALLDIGKTFIDYSTPHGQSRAMVYFVSPAIVAATMILVVFMIQLDRVYGLYSDGVLFIYWFFTLVARVVTLYSYIRRAYLKSDTQRFAGFDDVFRFVTFCVSLCMVLVSFVLSCFSDLPPDYDRSQKMTPEASASFLSHITYWWFNRLIFSKHKHSLESKHMWNLNPRDLTNITAPGFQKLWKQKLERFRRHRKMINRMREVADFNIQENNGGLTYATETTRPLKDQANNNNNSEKKDIESDTSGKPSLFFTLVQYFGTEMLKSVALNLTADVFVFVNPMILSLLMTYVDSPSVHVWKGYLYASMFLFATILISLIRQQMLYISTNQGQRVRGSLISTIFKKALTMSNNAKKGAAVGEIVNLMSVDAGRIQMAFLFINFLWGCPVQIAIASYLLLGVVGPSIAAGLAVMVFVIPVNAVILTYLRKYQADLMKFKDRRIKLFNEVLSGIKVLKLYAWEPPFEDKVSDIREKELNLLKKIAYLDAIVAFIFTMLPFVTCLATFATYVLVSDRALDANTAFVTLSYINILRQPINKLPFLVTFVIQAMVSMGRIEQFLTHDDIDESNVIRNPHAKHALTVENGTFSWGEGEPPTLKEIDLTISDGTLVAVVGQVGAGKSSLLSAILGEMDKIQGEVIIKSSTAYVTQQAWIQNATVENNILFGAPRDDTVYGRVLEACALKEDLKILSGGDQCEIGEKGINLSGGQKQRVSLARAVYSDADIYFLDDPLSAVDAHVGNHIFEQVIGQKGLLKNKTRVLVTHGIHWLPHVDRIIVLVDGCISEIGSYEELRSHNGAFAQYLKNHATDYQSPGADNPEGSTLLNQKQTLPSPPDEDEQAQQSGRKVDHQRLSVISQNESVSLINLSTDNGRNTETLITEEATHTGKVQWSVFLTYMRAIGIKTSIGILVVSLIYQSASVLSNIWLSKWTDDTTLKNTSLINTSIYASTQDVYLSFYGGSGVLQGVTILAFTLAFTVSSVSAARMLHSKMMNKVLRAPMSFFDTTPTGRIVNRFAKDVEIIDNTLADTIRTVMSCILTVVSSIVVICYSTPLFTAMVVPIGLIYYLIQRVYIPTTRQLKRIESITRSPIYNHFSETLNGASTIRAYGAQDRFILDSESKVDHNLILCLAGHASNRWLSFRLDVLGAVLVFATAMFSVVNKNSSSGATAGLVGLAISYALQITGGLNWLIRITSALETSIVSVERVKEYSEIETEAEWTHDNPKPSEKWPDKGCIEFDNHQVRYRKGLELVVKGISCVIKPQEKVGIVGRTGAGKSSLTLSLFRIIEAAGGSIEIDGINIDALGLHDLRSKLTILPQDPVLFAGTLRMNLDPFKAYTDEEIWRALEHSHLKSFVGARPEGLAYECGEGGHNLSVGQRQLVCLGRSLLRKTKILILDEATAAIDLETDALIQTTIRSEFADCTILTIAHRINTILDYDKVMVLDKGEIREFDSPTSLLKIKTSMFYSLAETAGVVPRKSISSSLHHV